MPVKRSSPFAIEIPVDMSVLKLPYLRRTGDIDKPPLLALSLSRSSFLAADLRDDGSASPLYSTTTVNMTTSILRATTKIADIIWPSIPPPKGKGKKAPDGVLLQLPGAAWIAANSFLKPSTSMDRPRKFRLPHYSHNMKWQKRSSGYWCTTSTVKGPIATYEPATEDLPGRLTVYETLQDEHDVSPMPVHRGVSILLLDYLLITCVLLVTDAQECITQSSGPGSLSDSNSNTDLLWKQITHGQYLFRSPPPVTTQDSTPADYENELTKPTSQEHVVEITHNHSLDPHFQQASTSHLSLSSQSDNGYESHSTLDISAARTSAVRADPLIHPLSNPSVSSHNCIDPSIYADSSVPSVPHHFTNEIREPPLSVSAASSTCQLPVSDDSSSRPASDQTPGSDCLATGPPLDASLSQRRSSVTSISRSRSISRPLPRTPATSITRVDPRVPVTRRSHSHTRLDQRGVEKPWSSIDVPPLPPLPSTATLPTTSNQGRSLPPTPYDLTTIRTPSNIRIPTRAMTTGVDNYIGAQLVRKNFGSDYEQRGRSSDSPLGWMQTDQNGPSSTRPSFDYPPPPYTSIDFHAPDSGWKPDS